MMRKAWRWLCKNSVPVQKKAGYILGMKAQVEVARGLPKSHASTNG